MTKEMCLEHSANCEALDELKAFRDRQEGKDGINQRIFTKLDEVAQKQSWMLGGLAALCFLITLLVAVFAAYPKK